MPGDRSLTVELRGTSYSVEEWLSHSFLRESATVHGYKKDGTEDTFVMRLVDLDLFVYAAKISDKKLTDGMASRYLKELRAVVKYRSKHLIPLVDVVAEREGNPGSIDTTCHGTIATFRRPSSYGSVANKNTSWASLSSILSESLRGPEVHPHEWRVPRAPRGRKLDSPRRP